MRAFLADGLLTDGDAGAVDQAVQTAKPIKRGFDRGLAVVFARDVALDIARSCAEFFGERLARRLVDVGDDGFAARGDDHFDGCGAEA